MHDNESDLKNAILAKAKELILAACSKYSLEPKGLDVSFGVSRAYRGWAAWHWGTTGRFELKFNLELAMKNQDEFLNQVVGHEVAHIINYWRHPVATKEKGYPAHGYDWQVIMVQCFGLVPARCHQMDTSEVSTRMPRPYVYKCNCQTHHLNSIRHNKILSGKLPNSTKLLLDTIEKNNQKAHALVAEFESSLAQSKLDEAQRLEAWAKFVKENLTTLTGGKL